MQFVLKHYDTPLMKFTASIDTSEPEIEILWMDEGKKYLLPLDMQPMPDELCRWLFRRTIPKHRAFVHELLTRCGLSLNRPMHIISVCKGLSLNDCYQVVLEDFDGTFAKNNVFARRLRRQPPKKRLHLMEQQVQRQAKLLLEV